MILHESDQLGKQRLAVYKDEATRSDHQCRMIAKDKSMQVDLKLMTNEIMGIYCYGLTAKLNATSSSCSSTRELIYST